MKTVFCRGCGQLIAETAVSCPSCGVHQQLAPTSDQAWGNWTAWAIACVPILGPILEVLLAKILGHANSFMFLVTLGLNIFLCTIDAKALRERGSSEDQLGNIFLIPV